MPEIEKIDDYMQTELAELYGKDLTEPEEQFKVSVVLLCNPNFIDKRIIGILI